MARSRAPTCLGSTMEAKCRFGGRVRAPFRSGTEPISLFAVRLSPRAAEAKRTYGYARNEAIGATINGGLLFLVAG